MKYEIKPCVEEDEDFIEEKLDAFESVCHVLLKVTVKAAGVAISGAVAEADHFLKVCGLSQMLQKKMLQLLQ